MTEPRRLQVWIGRKVVGDLIDADAVWQFAYNTEWLANPNAIPLSPHLPLAAETIIDGATRRPVQWFFDNLLPEEALRTRLAREAHVADADAFGLLEAYGAESAGALTLLTPGTRPPEGHRSPLTEAELLRRIRNLPRETLEARAPKKMSLAGAQHKLAVIIEDDEVFEPDGEMPSTHILKPNHPDAAAYPHSAVNEWFTMSLAAMLDLDVPAVSHRYVPAGESPEGHEAVYVVNRFDRAREGAEVVRRHAIDACQVLNVDRTYKYSEMSIDNLVRLADHARSRAQARTRLFRWSIFNVLVANADAHLKNLSFMVTPRGLELAPHYDLVSTGCFDAGAHPAQWGQVPMSLKLSDAERFAEVSVHSLVSLGEALGLRAQVAQRIVDTMRGRVAAAADALLADFERRPFPQGAAIVRGGELHVLRQIRHVVITDMERQLQRGRRVATH